MNAVRKLEEVRDILHAVVTGREGTYDRRLTRAARLLESALEDFFIDADDTAALPLWFDDEPFPAA